MLKVLRTNNVILIVAVCLLLVFSSCNKKKTDDNTGKKAVARAFNKMLYVDDLKGIIPRGVSHNDSIRIVKEYIQNWVRQQVVLTKAEDNLDESKKDVTRQLEEYRNSLITFAYESELIRQKLDTSVTDEEIEKYYNDHLNNFQLKNNIVKVLYLKIPGNAPKINKVRQWFRSDATRDRKLLEEYCYQFATDYYFKDDDWMPFDDLQSKVPIETYDQEQYLRNNRFIEIPDSASVYFVNIKGFKIKESLSPLSFEKDNIRNLIINKRKLDLIEAMENSAYDQALKNNHVEFYKPTR